VLFFVPSHAERRLSFHPRFFLGCQPAAALVDFAAHITNNGISEDAVPRSAGPPVRVDAIALVIGLELAHYALPIFTLKIKHSINRTGMTLVHRVFIPVSAGI
jgi:hypothetical protein